MNDSTNTSLEPLNEVYFNSQSRLKRLETIFASYQKELDKIPWDAVDAKIVKQVIWPKTSWIAKYLKELFGFSEVYIDVPEDGTTGYWMRVHTNGNLQWIGKEIPNKDYTDIQSKRLKTSIKLLKAEKKLDDRIESQIYPDMPMEPFKPLYSKDYIKHLHGDSDETIRLQKEWDQYEQDMEKYSDGLKRYEQDKKKYSQIMKMLQNRRNKYRWWLTHIGVDREYEKLPKKKIAMVGFKEREIGNDTYIDGTPFDAKQCIIVDKNGIKFDKNVFQQYLYIDIDPTLFAVKTTNKYAYTPQMLVSILLHEIGHTFASFILNIDPQRYSNTTKVDEIFADQFVAMYGYGYHFIKTFESDLVRNFAKIKSKNNNTNRGLIQDIGLSVNVHPFQLNRIYRILDQMKADLADPDISSFNKKRLQNDINKSAEVLKRLMNPEKYYALDKNFIEFVHKVAMIERGQNKNYQIGSRDADPNIINTELKSRMIRQRSQ